MILNVSGRTDVCAFYLDWFINRLNEGYVYVRNPYYNKQVSKVILDEYRSYSILYQKSDSLIE